MTVFVISEDRPEAEPGLRLAIASLSRYAPDCQINCYKPWQSNDFDVWATQFRNLRLIRQSPVGASSWNCKPHALIPVFENGGNEAVWIDSDIIVTRDPRGVFQGLSDTTIAVGEEPYLVPCPNGAEQAAAWGWAPGRELQTLINSSIVRVTRKHMPLLIRWRETLTDSRYIECQTKPFDQRPRHMLSDQDVLFSILGSREFADISIRILRDGTDILHCGGALGYSFQRRIGDVFKPVPTFLHAIAGKPWWIFHSKYADIHSKTAVYYRRLLQEVSPYTIAARQYQDMLDYPLPWLKQRSIIGRFMELIAFRRHALLGMPITMVASLLRLIRWC